MAKPVSLAARFKAVRLLVCDVDGVLTDGGLFIDFSGRELKRFSALDGTGFALARLAGIATAFLSARTSRAVTQRGRECAIDWVLQGQGKKITSLEKLCREENIPMAHVAFVGDDLLDLPVLEKVGLAVAVANAVADVKQAAHYITRTPGGHGAVREVVERILRAQGTWLDTKAAYLHSGKTWNTPSGSSDPGCSR
jgi:3-deoxy-D-manno-octulosonate 8-phosphate phosphatase (KDO 8-P phosphatase)